MENWEDKDFNKAWQEALSGAEAEPNPQVWEKIDTAMLARENTAMKKSVIFYQRLAAASVGILFLASGYIFWSGPTDSELLSTTTSNKSNSVQSNELNSLSNNKVNGLTNSFNKSKSDGSEAVLSNALTQTEKATWQRNNSIADNSFDGFQNTESPLFDNPKSTSNPLVESRFVNTSDKVIIFNPKEFELHTSVAKLPAVAKPAGLGIAYRVASARPAVREKKKTETTSNNEIWASFGLAAGNMMNSPSNLNIMQSSFDAAPAQVGLQKFSNTGVSEEQKRTSAYTVSIAGGKRVSKRWILHGGVGYINLASASSAQYVSATAANLSDTRASGSFAPEYSNTVTNTTNSTINSTFQFISVPMQAGYLLLDRKLGIQLNGGLSPDFFINSQTTDQATGIEVSERGSSSNTFKAVTVSGLGGVELSYRVSDRYLISITPGIRYPLTGVYQENTATTAKPFTADIGLRLRYVF